MSKRREAELIRRAPLVPSRSIPLRNFGIPETETDRAIRRIPFGRRVGLLTIDPFKPVGKARQVKASCDCGHSGWYTPLELAALIDAGRGCGRLDCVVVGFKDVVEGDPVESLRLQLFCLLRLYPEDVQSPWGGTLDDMVSVDLDEALQNLQAYLDEVMPEAWNSVWLARLEETLPFVEGNVMLRKRPDAAIRGMAKRRIDVGGQSMSIKELCEVTGLSSGDLMLRIYRAGDEEDLLYQLLNWGET